jgi:tRNA(Ile)-lysidine synthase TilS/MesJ
MCKLCETNPVYEFTNKRKLCKKCFIDYFHKKVLYTIRKFGMIRNTDIIGYKKQNDFRGIVLEEVLEFAKERIGFELIKISGKKTSKIVSSSSIDSEAENIVKILINGNVSELKNYLPIQGNIIKPLYLFLDEEILLYAKLRGLKFRKEKEKKNKIKEFTDEFEKKHPEVKRAIVNSVLELYNKEE